MSTLKVDTLQNATGENLVFNNKNLLINGGMNIWQRGTSASSKTTSGYYTADRFRNTISSMGTWTYSQSTDVPSGQGFGYSLKLDCTTADASPAASDFHSLQHRIEGQNLQHLLKGSSSAKALTLSFWVKSNKTGTYIASIFDNDNSRNISKSYTISSASTWEKKEITFDGDTTGTLDNDNANSLQLEFFFGAGTDYSSGTLATSWESYTQANRAVGQVNLADSTSNEFYLTGCQMETGSVATDFEFEPYERTLSKCQRYYEHIPMGRADVPGGIVINTSGAFRCPPITFKVNKRTLATMSQLNAWTFTWYDGATNTCSAQSIDGNSYGFSVSGTSSSSRSTYQALIGGGGHMASDTETYTITADAEL